MAEPKTFDEILSESDSDEHLDPLIRPIVEMLNKENITTNQSCQGGFGHAYDEPTICFDGRSGDAYRALGLCLLHGHKVTSLSMEHYVEKGQITETYWKLTFNFGKTHSGFFMRRPDHCGSTELPMLEKMSASISNRIKEINTAG